MYIVINRILVEIWTLKMLLRGSKGNEKHAIGKWKKSNPGFVLAKSFTELWPTIVWETELISDGYLAEKISKQSIEDEA